MTNRLHKIDIIFNNSDLDVAAIVPGSNFKYLTGVNFHLMERPTLLLLKKTLINLELLFTILPEDMSLEIGLYHLDFNIFFLLYLNHIMYKYK